jgi:hypothetical protein
MLNNNPLGITIIALVNILFGIIVMVWSLMTMGSMAGLFQALLSRCPCSLIAKAVLLSYMVWSIIYLHSPKVKALFGYRANSL